MANYNERSRDELSGIARHNIDKKNKLPTASGTVCLGDVSILRTCAVLLEHLPYGNEFADDRNREQT